MKFLIIACSMLEDELKQASEKAALETDNSYDIVYWSKDLHQNRAQLRHQVANLLAAANDYDAALLLPGSCGGIFDGLSSPVPVVLPRADDCISLLLGSSAKEKGVFYLTPAWLAGEESFLAQYEKLVASKGADRAQKTLRSMLAPYHAFCFLEQQEGEAILYAEQLSQLEELFKLSVEVCEKQVALLERLLLGSWGEGFLLFAAEEEIKSLIGDCMAQ